MRLRYLALHSLLAMLPLLYMPRLAVASNWRTITLPARPLNIAATQNSIFVCGADELIAESADGGKTWNVQHLVKGGGVFLTVGAVGQQFAYAAGTAGALLLTHDGGKTWARVIAPAPVIYNAAFSDNQHGLIQTAHAIYTTSNGGASWNEVKIDLASPDLKGFPFVRQIVSLDANHMAIVLSEGNAAYFAYKLLITQDGGSTWKAEDIAHTGLNSVTTYNGGYWAAGFEVVDRKNHGGHSVPLVMHSADGENWTHLIQWGPKEFSACNSQTCLFDNGVGVDFRTPSPLSYWTFPAGKDANAKWAVAGKGICSVGTVLNCAEINPTPAMPPELDDPSPIPVLLAPPPLDAPETGGLQCIACDVERVMVAQDYQGQAEVDLNVHVATNGLVENVDVVHATRPEIGERFASEAQNWIFVPYEQNGVARPVVTSVKLHVQVVKSK